MQSFFVCSGSVPSTVPLKIPYQFLIFLQCHVPSPGALEKRGVGALELVAMDMKTRYGMYFQVFCAAQP